MYPGPESAVSIGQVLAAKYRIERVLGEGGMGIVVAATHLQLDQLVALKFIRREAMANPEIVSRFEREARAAVRLKSEHVARILDVGWLESGAPFMVMEHLEGQDLSSLLRQHGPLEVSTACDFIVQACDAIAEAHGLEIVHRDLKPGNLFLASTSHGQRVIKVLDFGISKSQSRLSAPDMTRTQAIMGSPGYMSPEQMRSTKNVDGRTDLWSLGVILYELVAGRAPFEADTFTALCLKVSMDPPPPLPALGLRAALPPGFEEVVARALQKDPALRYQSARELAHALAPFGTPQTRERAQRLGGAPAASPASSGPHVVPAAPAQSTLHAATGQVRADTPAPRGRLRRWAFAGLGVCAAVGLGIGASVLRGGGGEMGGGKGGSGEVGGGEMEGGEVEGGAGGAGVGSASRPARGGLPQTPAPPTAPPVAAGAPPAEPRPPDPAPDAGVAISPHDAGSAAAPPTTLDRGTGARITPADARRAPAPGSAGARPGASSIDPYEHSE